MDALPPVASSSAPAGAPSGRRRWLILASVAVVAMLIGAVAASTVLIALDRVGRSDVQYTVRVFLVDDITPAQKAGVEATLSELRSVEQVRFRTREQALREFQERYKDEPNLTRDVKLDTMPESFQLVIAAERFDCAVFVPVSRVSGVEEVLVVQLASDGKERAIIGCPGMRKK